MITYKETQDFFQPIYSREKRHLTWGRLSSAIERFQLMMEIQEHELTDSLQEITNKKLEYLQAFIEYKQSRSQDSKDEVIKVLPKQVPKFFHKGYEEIVTIISFFKKSPATLSRLLTLLPPTSKTFSLGDMAQNLVGMYISYYMIYEQSQPCSDLSLFVQAVVKDWEYTKQESESSTIKNDRIHARIVLALFTLPEPEQFMESLYAKLVNGIFSEVSQQDSIDTNQERIKEEVRRRFKDQQERKSKVPQKKLPFYKRIFHNQPRKPSKEDCTVLQSTKNAEAIMNEVRFIQKNRVQLLNHILKRVVKLILQQQVPSIVKFLMKKFCQKLTNEKRNRPGRDYGVLMVKHWMTQFIRNKLKKAKHPQIRSLSFLLNMVDHIFMGQFHLVNIDDQFSIPLADEFQQEIAQYYNDIFSTGNLVPKTRIYQSLVDYQTNIKLLTFREIVLIVSLVKAAQKKNDLDQPLLSLDLSFSQNMIYDLKHRIKFKNQEYISHNIYFCFTVESQQVFLKNSYLGSRFILEDLPYLGETLTKKDLPVDSALKMSSGLEFLRGVEPKFAIKAFEGLQNIYPGLPEDMDQIGPILSLEKRTDDLLQDKSKFLVFKQMILSQMTIQITLISSYITQAKSQYMLLKYVKEPIQNMEISVFVAIQKGTIRIQAYLPESSKKLLLSSILMTRKPESNDQNVMNEILENSYKEFKKVKALVEAISRLEITKKAFTDGKKTDQFNQFFKRMCQILNSQLQKRFQGDKDKIDMTSQKKMFNQEISKMLVQSLYKKPQIPKDKAFLIGLQAVDIQKFKEIELAELPLEDFAFQQAIKQFKDIDDKGTPQAKLAQFDRLIRQIFKVISLTIPREKITAQVITPVVQYVVLKAGAKHSFRSALCLCIDQNAETSYLLTLWRSALRYLSEMMKQSRESFISSSASLSSPTKSLDNSALKQ